MELLKGSGPTLHVGSKEAGPKIAAFFSVNEHLPLSTRRHRSRNFTRSLYKIDRSLFVNPLNLFDIDVNTEIRK